MRNVNVQENVVISKKFGFIVQEFRLHWLATMTVSTPSYSLLQTGINQTFFIIHIVGATMVTTSLPSICSR